MMRAAAAMPLTRATRTRQLTTFNAPTRQPSIAVSQLRRLRRVPELRGLRPARSVARFCQDQSADSAPRKPARTRAYPILPRYCARFLPRSNHGLSCTALDLVHRNTQPNTRDANAPVCCHLRETLHTRSRAHSARGRLRLRCATAGFQGRPAYASWAKLRQLQKESKCESAGACSHFSLL